MLINLNLKELSELMADVFDIVAIEAAIKNIHVANGVDNATVTKEITDAVSAGVAPLQTQLTTQQGQIADLQKALQDTVAALTSGDTAAAQATATAALNASTSGDGSAAGTGAAGNGTAGTAQ